jgi:hypothetical protein
MSYAKLYLGKELDELTYADIENFFVEPRDESDKIEFKSYYSLDEKNHAEKENGIIKAICGLLNSEGGLIIWGAPVGRNIEGKKEKIFQGALSPTDKLIEKDSFISRVTDLITPSPNGIKFQYLQKEGKYVYIIEVNSSSYSPHQFRNCYYMRIDGQTKPAPHHYIEALFRKVTFPKLEGFIKFGSIKTDGTNYILQISNMIFNQSKLQNEYDIYYRVIVTVGTFYNYGFAQESDKMYTMDGHELRNHNAKATLYHNEPLTNTELVIFNPYNLVKTNMECRVHFYFGGKQSPLMISEYKLLLKNIPMENANNLIVSMTENQFAYEKSDKIELSDKERMKIILGR